MILFVIFFIFLLDLLDFLLILLGLRLVLNHVLYCFVLGLFKFLFHILHLVEHALHFLFLASLLFCWLLILSLRYSLCRRLLLLCCRNWLWFLISSRRFIGWVQFCRIHIFHSRLCILCGGLLRNLRGTVGSGLRLLDWGVGWLILRRT